MHPPHKSHPQHCPSTDELHIPVFERKMKNAISVKRIDNSLKNLVFIWTLYHITKKKKIKKKQETSHQQ